MAYQQQLPARRLWSALFDPEVEYGADEIPIVISLCYYMTTIILGRVLRSLNKTIVPNSYQIYIFDMILTFQMCACSLENIMLRNSYGIGGYALALFMLGVWYALTIKDGYGNPCQNVIAYVGGRQGAQQTLLRCLLQMASALVSYRYASLFWGLSLTAGHGRRFKQMHCTSGMSVMSPTGFGIELVATFLQTLISLLTVTNLYYFESFFKALIGTIMTCLGVHLTGMYLNPANAFTQEFGCQGASTFEHIFVYWVAPVAGAVMATTFAKYACHVFKALPSQVSQSSQSSQVSQPRSERPIQSVRFANPRRHPNEERKSKIRRRQTRHVL